MFGFRARIIEDAISIPVVNASLHGGLGPGYLSFFAEQLLRRGDVLLVIFEYPLLTGDTLVNDRATFVSWARRDGYWHTLDLSHQLRFFRSFTLRRLISLSRNPPGSQPGRRLGPWSVDMFSVRGDLRVDDNLDVSDERRSNFAMDSRNLPARQPQLFLDPRSPNLQSILGLIDAAKHMVVTVYATWPAVRDHELYRESYKRLVDSLPLFYGQVDVPFIRLEKRGFIPSKYIYKTAFHLNSIGATQRTRFCRCAVCTDNLV